MSHVLESPTILQAIDVSFQILGEKIPFEHGYALYSAISLMMPALHEADWLGIHPVYGPRLGEESIQLRRGSEIRLRIPPDRLGEVLPLIGKNLDIAGNSVRVG